MVTSWGLMSFGPDPFQMLEAREISSERRVGKGLAYAERRIFSFPGVEAVKSA